MSRRRTKVFCTEKSSRVASSLRVFVVPAGPSEYSDGDHESTMSRRRTKVFCTEKSSSCVFEPSCFRGPGGPVRILGQRPRKHDVAKTHEDLLYREIFFVWLRAFVFSAGPSEYSDR